ncbi:hypothetical protein EI94DRAFT_1010768 [Lactarius quietus]|nr:hypothetical protein EI94DRAFT_1010768 [Lactarius quietus]
MHSHIGVFLSLLSAPCSCRRCAQRRSLSEWACTSFNTDEIAHLPRIGCIGGLSLIYSSAFACTRTNNGHPPPRAHHSRRPYPPWHYRTRHGARPCCRRWAVCNAYVLRSHNVDLIIAADNVKSTIQKIVTGRDDHSTPTGNAAYRARCPTSLMFCDPEFRPFVDTPGITGWMAPGVSSCLITTK